MNLISKLLHKNTSPSRVAGFVVSNLIGLTIMAIGLQFYIDARSIWNRKDSFLKSDFLAINKIIDSSSLISDSSTDFTPEDIADLERQPWVEKVGKFSRADFRVYASVGLDSPSAGGDAPRRMSTAMFFESVPDDFLDVADGSFSWHEGDESVPVIISKDYIALYNFGFAGAAGLPQLSESIISGIPLQLTLSDDSGSRRIQMYGNVAGYSNRFNTILVPQSFLDYMNAHLGSTSKTQGTASRLIIDVNSPGDAAIAPYLESKGWEPAGDKSASTATYLLRTVSAIIISIGTVITLLSILILILSISLIMEKNRRKIHSLLMLGYPLRDVERPYLMLTGIATLAAGLLSFVALWAIRSAYIGKIEALCAAPAGGMLWPVILIIAMSALIIFLNALAIRRRIRDAWPA